MSVLEQGSPKVSFHNYLVSCCLSFHTTELVYFEFVKYVQDEERQFYFLHKCNIETSYFLQ